jgi:hypothetical protein
MKLSLISDSFLTDCQFGLFENPLWLAFLIGDLERLSALSPLRGLVGVWGAGDRGLTSPAKVVSAFQAWGLDGESTRLGRVIVIRWAQC